MKNNIMKNFNCDSCKFCKHDYVYGTETEPDAVHLASCALYHQDDWVEDRFKDVLNYNRFIASSISIDDFEFKLIRQPRWCELKNDSDEEVDSVLKNRIKDVIIR